MPFGIKRAIRRSVDMLFFLFYIFPHVVLVVPIALKFPISSYIYKLLVISYIKILSGHTGYCPTVKQQEQAVTWALLAIATRITYDPTRIFVFFT